jgi:phosphatidate cytidylyltransferase
MQQMYWKIYIIILAYFALGTAGIWYVNRHKEPEVARKAWIKHVTYFIITNSLFFVIAFGARAFHFIAVVIIIVGFFELIKLFFESGFRHSVFFIVSLFILSVLSAGFFFFSKMEHRLILFAFLILCIFDGFSQVTGQVFGKRKLFPNVSPNKTVEGLAGGVIMAVVSTFIFRQLLPDTKLPVAMLLSTVVALCAFAGDTAKSVYKRKYNVKDFSGLIPGHGGFLDRFDSLIAGGAGVALLGLLMSLT